MQSGRLIGRRYCIEEDGLREGWRRDKGRIGCAHVRARAEHLLPLSQSRLVWAEGNTEFVAKIIIPFENPLDPEPREMF